MEQKDNLLEVIRTFLNWRKPLIIVGLITALTSVAVSLLLPNYYQANTIFLAVSPDQFRIVYFQGHPEYDAVSLLKEYKREVSRYLQGELEAAPAYPENFFSTEAIEIADRFIAQYEQARTDGDTLPAFPEQQLESHVDNTLGDTGKAIVNNWLGLVYQLTNLDRKLQFMSGVDRDDPLQLVSQP